jgi:hypothetical protein
MAVENGTRMAKSATGGILDQKLVKVVHYKAHFHETASNALAQACIWAYTVKPATCTLKP